MVEAAHGVAIQHHASGLPLCSDLHKAAENRRCPFTVSSWYSISILLCVFQSHFPLKFICHSRTLVFSFSFCSRFCSTFICSDSHASIGCGEIAAFHCGGYQNGYLFFVSGEALAQAQVLLNEVCSMCLLRRIQSARVVVSWETVEKLLIKLRKEEPQADSAFSRSCSVLFLFLSDRPRNRRWILSPEAEAVLRDFANLRPVRGGAPGHGHGPTLPHPAEHVKSKGEKDRKAGAAAGSSHEKASGGIGEK